RKRSGWFLSFVLGCGAVLLVGCIGCGIFFVLWSAESSDDDAPVVSGPVVAPDARAAMIGTYHGTYDASGSVAGIAAQSYHDRGTITVSEGEGGTLVFTSV